MGSEETVLNFMRCPGCRSYVPTSATRCRMCGATLSQQAAEDASAEASTPAEEISERRSSRIRQKTMTVSEATVQSVKASASAAQSAPAPTRSAPPEPATPGPSGFRFGERRADQVFPSPAQSPQSFDTDEDDGLENPVPNAQREGPRPDPAISERLSLTARALRDLDETPESESGSTAAEYEEEMEDRDDINEPDLSFSGAPRHENDTQEGAPRAKRKRRRRKKKRPGGTDLGSSTPLGTPGQTTENFLDAGEFETVATQPSRPAVSAAVPNPAPIVPQPAAARLAPVAPTAPRASRKVKEVPSGGLIGWFVSYFGDEGGKATEIRSGRFFICGERLKDTDLVLEDSSISTPHCLVKATAVEGLKVQDLMSEKGTYLRRREETEYRKQNETISVSHGDWLRFGDYEVMVCLIAFPYEDMP